MKKILIIEDDEALALEQKELLLNAGYNAIILEDFKNALAEIELINPDLILLDINIPYLSGEELLQILRKTSKVPIIMVTSRVSDIDEVISITYGADDYITKPYNPSILLLRINNIFKRINFVDTINYKDIIINISKGCILKGNKEILLTKNEMIIFNYFLLHQGSIVTRDELMTTLWNNNEFINDNALTVNISRLRNKLREVGLKEAIQTRKGYGYYLL